MHNIKEIELGGLGDRNYIRGNKMCNVVNSLFQLKTAVLQFGAAILHSKNSNQKALGLYCASKKSCQPLRPSLFLPPADI